MVTMIRVGKAERVERLIPSRVPAFVNGVPDCIMYRSLEQF